MIFIVLLSLTLLCVETLLNFNYCLHMLLWYLLTYAVVVPVRSHISSVSILVHCRLFVFVQSAPLCFLKDICGIFVYLPGIHFYSTSCNASIDIARLLQLGCFNLDISDVYFTILLLFCYFGMWFSPSFHYINRLLR